MDLLITAAATARAGRLERRAAVDHAHPTHPQCTIRSGGNRSRKRKVRSPAASEQALPAAICSAVKRVIVEMKSLPWDEAHGKLQPTRLEPAKRPQRHIALAEMAVMPFEVVGFLQHVAVMLSRVPPVTRVPGLDLGIDPVGA